jgi:4-hydroxybenzoate polyprenyltransferase
MQPVSKTEIKTEIMSPNAVTGFKAGSSTPLYVDMDGTLLATDILWEMLVLLAKNRPMLLLRAPFWLIKGKAYFKRQLASHVVINPAGLPYREPVLSFLTEERQKGRNLILATASDSMVAQSVARHVGLFSTVLASDGAVNLAGDAKLRAILRHADGVGFDYAGDSWVDLPIWRQASHAIVVEPSRRLLKKVDQESTIQTVLAPRRRSIGVYLRLLRVQQWSKNVLLFVPLLLAHQFMDHRRLLSALLAFVAFSLGASAVYIVNDLLDLESDRQHPHKRSRPLAAGLVPIPTALTIALLAVTASFGIAVAFLPWLFVGIMLLYQATAAAYTFAFKRIAILDVLILAGLYTARVLAGAVATDVRVSHWFLAFALFFFMSLAIVKRYSELGLVGGNGGTEGFLAARGYEPGDRDFIGSIGAASAYVAVAVFALYISSPDVHLLYQRPSALWLIIPILLYWVTRTWFLAHRGKMHGDPVVFALTDRTSYLLAVLIASILLIASLT